MVQREWMIMNGFFCAASIKEKKHERISDAKEWQSTVDSVTSVHHLAICIRRSLCSLRLHIRVSPTVSIGTSNASVG